MDTHGRGPAQQTATPSIQKECHLGLCAFDKIYKKIYTSSICISK